MLASLLRKARLEDMVKGCSHVDILKQPQNLRVPGPWHSMAGTGQPTADHGEEQRRWPPEA